MTKMDTKCQEVIRSYVNRHFPGHVTLGEEEVPPGSAASKVALRTSLERSDWCAPLACCVFLRLCVPGCVCEYVVHMHACVCACVCVC